MVKQVKDLTLKVKTTRGRELRVRVWLAQQMLRLTALVLNCNIEFIGKDNE